MTGAAMLALLLAQAAPAVPASAPDVVVTALHRLRLVTDIRHGYLAECTVRVSSGDADIDRAACDAVRGCVAVGTTASEALASCADARLVTYVRARADAPAENK